LIKFQKNLPQEIMGKKSLRKKDKPSPLQFVQEKRPFSMYRLIGFLIWVIGVGVIIWKYGNF